MLAGLRAMMKAAWRCIKAIPQSIYARGLLESISNAMTEHERHGRSVTRIVLGPKEWCRLYRCKACRYAVDMNTNTADVKNGQMGKLWGVTLFVRKNMAGKVVLFS